MSPLGLIAIGAGIAVLCGAGAAIGMGIATGKASEAIAPSRRLSQDQLVAALWSDPDGNLRDLRAAGFDSADFRSWRQGVIGGRATETEGCWFGRTV
jgi:hypothetical protein